MTDYLDVDVRPALRAGEEPFHTIMMALDRLQPGQGLRLYATFRPIPLLGVMADKGFAFIETELDGGDWEVIFTPAPTPSVAIVSGDLGNDEWPEPMVRLDNRDLDPPEPMVRILAAANELRPGETLTALLRREPLFLFPELEKRGYRWLGGFWPDGLAYELTIRAPP